MLTAFTKAVRQPTARLAALVAFAIVAGACGSAAPSASPTTGGGSTAPATIAPSTNVSVPPTGSIAPPTEVTTTPTPATPAPTATTSTPAGGCAAIDGYVPIANGRRALVRAPKATARRPAVVVLHGYTGTPERIEQTSGWTAFAGPKNAVAVYPEGTPVSGGGFAWTTGSARYSASGADDIGYLDALVTTLVDKACADPARILITGESNGGAMTLLAACDARTRDRFTTFAPVIPAIDARVVERCGPGPALDFVALASRLDRTVPYDGVYPTGQIALSGQEQWFLQVAAQRNQCNPTNPTREPIRDAEVIRPTGCTAAPTLVAVTDGSHTWPGGPTGTGGLSPGTFGATVYLWDRLTTA